MASKDIQIKGSFDASQILASFRKIRDEAAKSNVSDKLLGGYDKELEKVEKLITQITAAQSRGLTDNQSIKEFSRLVGQLEKQFGILNVKAQGFTDVANYKTESANLKKYTNQLEALIKKQDGLRKAAEDYIDANKKSLGINEKEAKQLKKAMADAEAYKKVVDDLVISKAKAAQQLATTESVKTDVGKKIVDNATGGNFEFGVAAKKGRDKSRENLAAKGQIDEQKALAAAQKEYQETLRKTMEEGGTAEDAIKSFIEVMQKYKLEVKNADEVQQQFQQDMDKIVDTAMNTTKKNGGLDSGIKSNVTKGYNQSQAATNLVNAQPIQEYNNNLNEQVTAKEKIAQENDKLHKQNEQAAADQRNLNEDAKKTSQNIVNGLNTQTKEAQKYVNIQDQIKSGFESLGRGAKQILSVTTAWRSLRNVVKSTFNDVKALDKSFASIAMVTEYSVKDMWEQYDQYAAMANKLGQSTQSVVEASGLYYQQGLKTNEVLKLTEETMKLATLAGLDFKEATSQMTAALRAFHMDMSEGAHVTDVYAEVAAHAAVDVQGLSEAMSATAAIANSAGMSFENTTAMLATMVEATQEAPKNLGTAMKTILARFTELKTNVAGTADSEFDDLDYNKVDKALKSVGISIKDASGQFRNMDEVLLELSSKWKGLDRNSQRYIATIAAGSRQQSRFIALMENYERTMELVDVAQNSAGRSSQQFAKYQDTVEYKVNKIKNSWEQFRTSLLDSDAYKGALDTFGSFLDKLNNMSTTGLVTLTGTWLTLGRKAIGGTINNLSSGIGNLFSPKNSRYEFTQQYIQDNTKQVLGKKDPVAPSMDEANDAYEKAVVKGQKMGALLGSTISTSITTAITAGLTTEKPWTAATNAFIGSAIPNIVNGFATRGVEGALIGAGISLVSGAVSGIISWVRGKAPEDETTTKKQLEQLKSDIEDLDKSIDKQKSSIKRYANEINSLEKIKEQYSELHKKQIKTTEEQEKYEQLVKQVNEEYPELVSYYNKETGELELQNDLLDKKIEKTQKLKELETQQLYQNEVEKLSKGQREDRLTILNKAIGNTGVTKAKAYEMLITNDFNSEKIVTDLFNKVAPILQEEPELISIREQVQEIKQLYEQYFSEYQAIAKELINNTSDFKDLPEDQKNILAAIQGSKTTNAVGSTASVMDYINKQSFEQEENSDDTIDSTKQILSQMKNALKGNDFLAGLKAYGVDENLKDLIENKEDYSELKKTTRDFLKKLGVDTEEAYLELVKEGKISDRALREKYYNLILSKAQADQSQLTDTDIKRSGELSSVLKTLNSKDIDIQKYSEELNKIKQDFKDLPNITEWIRQFSNEDVIEEYRKKLEEYGLQQSEEYNKTSAKHVSALNEGFQGFIDKFSILGKDTVKEIYSRFTKIIEESQLSGDVAKSLLEISPDTFKDMDYNQSLEYIEKLITDETKSGHVGKKAGKEIAKSLLEGFQSINIANQISSSAASVEEKLKQSFEKATEYAQTYQDTLNLIASQYKENGFIDIFNIEKVKQGIKDLGLEVDDIINTDSKGNYIVDYKKLIEEVENNESIQDNIRKEITEQKDQAIQQLTIEKQMLIAIMNNNSEEYNKLKTLHAQTVELQNQAKLSADAVVRKQASELDINLDLSEFELSQSQKDAIQATIDDIDRQITEWTNLDIDNEVKNRSQSIFNQIKKSGKEFLENLEKERDKAYKDWVDKTKAVTDAQKSLAKAIETVTEKQKELKELIEGTDYKSSVDGMYNYTTAMNYWVKETERAKKKLEKAGSIAEAKNNYQLYREGLLKQKSQLTAQNKVYQTAYDNFGNILKNNLDNYMESLGYNKTDYNIEDFVTLDKTTGLYQLNQNATNKPGTINKYIKQWFDDYGSKANEYLTNIKENNDKIEQLDEEFLEYQKKARDEYIDLQDQMIDVLREKYQKEIDDLQNKYDAMNEADNKYLESLQKNLDRQRKLRDQEKNWNDLTNKERKLSLMQRDTSGGNLADVKNLQNEIEDQRTQLLDDAVDQIIEKLSEFYELQKESRDAEIQYKQTLIDDVNLLKEATEALEKIQTSDDLVNWWKENVTGIEAFSEQKLGKLTEDWDKLFSAKSNYVASIDDKMEQSVKDANGHLKEVGDQAEKIVKTTSEGITKLAKVSLEEAGEEYKDALKKAKEALQDAVDAVAKQKEALQAAIDAANESKKAFNELAEEYKGLLAQQGTKTVYVYNNQQFSNSGTLSSAMQREAIYKKGISAATTKTVSESDYNKVVQKETPKNVTISANYSKTPAATLSDPWNKKYQYRTFYKNKNNDIMAEEEFSTYMSENHGKNYGNYSKMQVEIPEGVAHGIIKRNKEGIWEYFSDAGTKELAEREIDYLAVDDSGNYREELRKQYRAFAQGGLVNYTGPAWVDGSRSRPEAFLSSEDTRRIGEAARILADLPILSQPIKEQVPTTTIGDTTIQIDVHVDSIANDYDLDEAMNKVEQRIVNAAKYAGSNVILKKH